MTCHACGAQLAANVRFCHKCGAAVGGGQATGWRVGLPWGVAGAALGALVTVVAMRAGGGARPQDVETRGGPVGIRPPDISQMSPEERATRLFDRVMILAQAGKQDSVEFFLPMAIGAYDQLPALDADARYHVGLLRLAGGDAAGALAQADTIQRAVPTHLFAYVLRAHAFQQQGNRQAERRAYADFLRHEAAEMARNRPEYSDHQNALTAFREEARRQQSAGRTTS
ncbi:MAG TPA: zinc ribbon domain-containing protein [Gemmatimonadales bacterium]|nr:zinc ribbon domain-containing protein [Gemmatimonadales bacterium]